MQGEYKQADDPQHGVGLKPMPDDGLTGALDGLSRGDGKPHAIPETYGNHGAYHEKSPAVGKMRIFHQILSKFPFTKENRARKAAKKTDYKKDTTVKTTAQRIAEAMEARDAQAKAGKEIAAGE